tara:strand:+ start:9093 stop:9473 length:381 start_codon:yes stop_codon:yes gene_type:complete
MTIGFIYTGTTYATPDKAMGKQSSPNVLMASFGDGYEQRVVNGINNIKESYSISFVNRHKADIDDIVAFFDSKGGALNFNFTIPDTNNTTTTGEKTFSVVCDSYSTSYAYDNFYNLTATLRRVYEP